MKISRVRPGTTSDKTAADRSPVEHLANPDRITASRPARTWAGDAGVAEAGAAEPDVAPPAPTLTPLDDSTLPDSLLVSFDNYAAAQAVVDQLSDKQFPVEHTAIVGSDLRLVEKVTGRLTYARAAAAGAGSGAWLGLLLGLVLGLFTDRAMGWLGTVLVTVVIFVFWGAVFGLVAHALTGGKRDFASRSVLVAGRYDVRVAATHAAAARRLLAAADARDYRN